MAALRSACGYYIFNLWFLLSIFFYLFPSPNLSRHRLDVYHTCTLWCVALVRIQDAELKCAARGWLEIQDAKMTQKIDISAPSHNFVGLYLCNRGMYRQSEKNLLSSNISSTCPDNMVNLEPKFQGEGSSLGNIFWFLQNYTHFAIQQCKLHRATYRLFDTIRACDGQMDGRTDGIAIANTALAMRAL